MHVNSAPAVSKSRITDSVAFLVLGLVLTFGSVNAGATEQVQFEVETATGSLSAEELLGEVVYIDFWASWCAPCRESFPWMNTMHQRYADRGLRIIAINLDKNRALSDQFLSEVPAEFTIGFDPEAELALQFELVGMPSAFVINRQGELIAKHVGFRKAELADYEKAIVEALE